MTGTARALSLADTGIPRSPLLALDDAFYKAHSALIISSCAVEVSLQTELSNVAEASMSLLITELGPVDLKRRLREQ